MLPVLDLRRYPARLGTRQGRDAWPWWLAGGLAAVLLLGVAMQALPDAAHWQARLQAHEDLLQQQQARQAQARAQQARQAQAARHEQQGQAWQARQVWLGQLWQGLASLPAGLVLQQLQIDETSVQVQLWTSQERALQTAQQQLTLAGTGPWRVRQQSVQGQPTGIAGQTRETSEGWLFVLQTDLPVAGADGAGANGVGAGLVAAGAQAAALAAPVSVRGGPSAGMGVP